MGAPKASQPHMPGYGEYATKGKGFIPWTWAADRLEKAHNYWVATTRPDGQPHVFPVWGIWLEGAFYFSSSATSRKARNLAANPRCTVHLEDGAESVIVEGMAEEVTGRPQLERFKKVYEAKYNWDMSTIPGNVYAVRPRVAFGMLENTDDDTDCLTKWEFDYD